MNLTAPIGGGSGDAFAYESGVRGGNRYVDATRDKGSGIEEPDALLEVGTQLDAILPLEKLDRSLYLRVKARTAQSADGQVSYVLHRPFE